MIIKLPVCIDDKICFNNFLLEKKNDSIVVNIFNNNYEKIIKKIKVPLCNNFEGITYIDLYFPMTLKIYDKKLIFNNFFQKIFLSQNSLEIDFLNNLEKNIKSEYNLEFINKDELPTFDIKIWKYWNEYNDQINIKNNEGINLKSEEILKNLWEVVQLYQNVSLYLIYLKPNFTNKTIYDYQKLHKLEKKIINLANIIKSIKFSIYSSNDYIFNEHLLRIGDYKAKLSEIKIGFRYFIKTLDSNKFFQVEINNINDNIIHTVNNQAFIFENYEWYFYISNLDFDIDIIFFNLLKNNKIYEDFMERSNLKIELIHSRKILDYYLNNNECNLIYFRKYFENYYSDMEILKRNNYSNTFFNYIIQKYDNGTELLEVFQNLFLNYTYPIRQNKLDKNFDHILFFSFYHIEKIFSKENKFDKQNLESSIMDLIPSKLKLLYYNLTNLFYQVVIKNNYQFLISNQKFYNDYLHRTIIKIIFNNTKLLSSSYILQKMTTVQLNKVISIIKNSLLLIDVVNRLTWTNLPKRLHYVSLIYDNKDIIFFLDKFNKNIIPENYDLRLKKIIEYPFEMFKHLKKDKDYIKWLKFIGNNLNDLFQTPISLSSEDIIHLGKIIFLLTNITEQNVKNESYIKFLSYCQKHPKLILDNTRINMKIKENFPFLKININLGFLAKHLTFSNEAIIVLDDDLEKTQDLIKVEEMLRKVTKKYFKYKNKYVNSKKIDATELPLSATSVIKK
jgi:hypothetical protein